MPKICPKCAHIGNPSRKRSKICPKYAQNMGKICPKYGHILPILVSQLCPQWDSTMPIMENAPQYAQNMPRICPHWKSLPEKLQNMPKICPKYGQIIGNQVSEICPRNSRNMGKICPKYGHIGIPNRYPQYAHIENHSGHIMPRVVLRISRMPTMPILWA